MQLKSRCRAVVPIVGPVMTGTMAGAASSGEGCTHLVVPHDDADQLPDEPVRAARMQACHVVVQLGLHDPVVAFHRAGCVLVAQLPVAEAVHEHVCKCSDDAAVY